MLNHLAGRSDQDPLLLRAAAAIASDVSDKDTKAKVVDLITKVNDSKVRINQLVHAINTKQISPTRGTINFTQLAQNLAQARANIARELHDKPGEIDELKKMQKLLDLESNMLANVRLQKEGIRHASIQARNAQLFRATNKAIEDIGSAQDQVRRTSAAVRQTLINELGYAPPKRTLPKPDFTAHASRRRSSSSSSSKGQHRARTPPAAPKKKPDGGGGGGRRVRHGKSPYKGGRVT